MPFVLILHRSAERIHRCCIPATSETYSHAAHRRDFPTPIRTLGTLSLFGTASSPARQILGQASNRNIWERSIKSLKYTLTKKGRLILKQKLRDSNKRLRSLSKSAQEVAPSRTRRTSRSLDFELVREGACGVYDALQNGPWQCSCTVPQNANLVLEPRTVASVT